MSAFVIVIANLYRDAGPGSVTGAELPACPSTAGVPPNPNHIRAYAHDCQGIFAAWMRRGYLTSMPSDARRCSTSRPWHAFTSWSVSVRSAARYVIDHSMLLLPAGTLPASR